MEIAKHFSAIGARAKFRGQRRSRFAERADIVVDIRRDRKGEYFDFALADDAPELTVLQVMPSEKHLLLYSRAGQRFLCGHDERHWFVAQIADAVSTVRDAKRSLMPPAVREQVGNAPPGEFNNRRNPVFKRQGEWFFVPTLRDFVNPVIHKNEPLQKTAANKPHVCQELIREGGELVYVIGQRQYTEQEYNEERKQNPSLGKSGFKTMIRNPDMYVRGYVRHADHSTIKLEGWHRVFLNGELMTSAVAYLD